MDINSMLGEIKDFVKEHGSQDSYDKMDHVQTMFNIQQQLEPNREKIVEFRRDIAKHIVYLSAGIIGFSIPIINQADIIKNQLLFSIALILFTLVLIGGVLYMYLVNKQEINTYKKSMDMLQKSFEQTDEEVMDELLNYKKTIKSTIHDLKYYEKGYNTIMVIFIGGFIVLLLSLFIG